MVLTAIIGGIISDRIGKRKMIVTVSGALMGVAALLLTFVETWDAALVAAVLFGVGFGAYLAVDQALITQVLPAAADRAKDLGIINIAIVGPGCHRRRDRRPARTLRRLSDAVRRDSHRRRARLDLRLEDQERAVGRAMLGRRSPRPAAALADGSPACAPPADPGELPALRDQPARGIPDLGLLVEPAAADVPATGRHRERSRLPAQPACARSAPPSGAQPVAPRPNTTGGRPSTASASTNASGARSSRSRK